MAKEAELKRVDLKVSVNCCEGCKKKVLKALSIKGVLRTEIHPTLPKVTVIGNVDVGILIKKLSKVGKSAEVMAEEMQKPQSEEDKEKEDSGFEEAKPENNGKGNKSKSNGNDKDESRRDKEEEKNPMIVETTKSVYPTIVTAIPQMSLSYQTLAPPIAVHMPYYAVNANPAPAAYYIQDYRCYETPSYRPPPPPQSQAMAAFGDYFNEDNTVGCRIM